MGKPVEVRVEVPDLVLANSAAGGEGGRGGDAGIRRAVSVKCLVVLALGSCVLLSAIFWFPPFRSRRSGFVPDDPDSLHECIREADKYKRFHGDTTGYC
ncbi:hypothetical protein MUK42_15942 [Musa troglodytarum]|uniref:Uncharacterized protein n=1 Tax=Musa troglodytarum TaxID=320322 RepID=A0A9E7KVG4_9LILI|nr:hypothetical protein MUK42_15942 [Musa troglodytarum]